MRNLRNFLKWSSVGSNSLRANCVSRLAFLHFGLHALRFGADRAGVSSILPQQKRETAEPDAPNNSARRLLGDLTDEASPLGPNPEPETRARPQLTPCDST